MMRKLFILTTLFTCMTAFGVDRKGRLGFGFTNQLQNRVPAISFKMHPNNNVAYSGFFGINTDDPGGGYGAGIKIFSTIFEEPNLSFFAAASGALLKSYNAGNDSNGFQFDFTLGSEFSFPGLHSIGFSFEMGVSINNTDSFVVETVGENFFTAGVHFYI